MPSFNQLQNNNNQFDNGVPFEYSVPGKKENLLSKVFGVMFLSLLFTGAASYGIAYLLTVLFGNSAESLYNTIMAVMIVSCIGSLVMAFVIPGVMAKGKVSILPSLIVYCLFISGILSFFFVFFDLPILLVTFAVTAGVFGIMGLLGYVSKGSFSGIGTVLGGLLIGLIILSIINIFMGSDRISWICSFAFLAFLLLITMYDVRRIKDIISSGYAENNNNMVLYCSFILYLDFIDIFIRLLPYIMKIYSENK